MIMLEPCRRCGKKDAITVAVIEKEAKASRWIITCNRCGTSVEGEAKEQDAIRIAWNLINKPPEGHIQ